MTQYFEGLFKDSPIFADREVLSPHYIPSHLLFRDKQITEIEKALTPSLRGDRGRNLFVYGKTGTGKTSCMKLVMDQIKRLPAIRASISYMNCRVYNSRYRVLSKIAGDHMPLYAKKGFGVIDIYEKLIGWIEEDGKVLLVVLDEIDKVKDLDDLIYTLSRANSDIKAGGITIVGISNNVSFKEELDPRSLSTLYENELVFPPYNSNELAAIIKERVSKGFKPNAVEPSCVNLSAAIAAKESGDARLALKIITKAGEIAEGAGLDCVTPKQITEAAKSAEEEIAYEVINTLPLHQRLILYAIALMTISGGKYRRLSEEGENFVLSGDIYSRYVSLAESMHKEPKSSRLYRKYMADLDMQGIIISHDSGKGIRGHTRLVKLTYQPNKIKEMVEKALFRENESADEEKPAASEAQE